MPNGPDEITITKKDLSRYVARRVAAGVVASGVVVGLIGFYSDGIIYLIGGPLKVHFNTIGPDNAKMVDETTLRAGNLIIPEGKPEDAPRELVEHLFEFRFIEGSADPYKCCYSSGGYHWCTTVQTLPCPPA